MDIVVKLIDGNDFKVKLNIDDIVENLKIKVNDTYGFPLQQQILVYGGKNLSQNNEKLITYGIVDGSCVTLSLYPKEFMLYIHISNDRILKIPVESKDKLMTIKSKIQKLVPMHIDEQVLIYNGKYLTENRLLSEYEILDTCVLKLVPKLREKVELLIKMLDNQKISFEVSSNFTISEIKSMLSQKMGILPAEQRLFLNGRILTDNETVSECFPLNNSVINFISGTRTGFQIFVQTLDQHCYPLEVAKTDKVIDLKRKIGNTLQWIPEKQKLVFRGKTLNNDEIVDKCGINWNSVINVILLN